VAYRLIFEPRAFRELRRLPPQAAARIVRVIDLLAEEPRPHGARKLVGQEAYRVRAGDYRVIYDIDDPGRAVFIVTIGHRREVY
jgi:mRNA interferase RelE/StbE